MFMKLLKDLSDAKQLSMDQSNVIQEDNFSVDDSKTRSKPKAPCRTAMGEFIVPEGGKPLTSLGNCMPGPSDYTPKVEPTRRAAPQYSIVGRPKRIDSKRHVPAPAEYDCSTDINWKAKKITLKGRGKSFFDAAADKSKTMLGKYKVEYKNIGKEGPKFKVGQTASHHTGLVNRLVHPVDTQGFQTPGPNYRPNSGYWGRGPQKSFGRKTQRESSSQKGPGPGDYDVQTDKRGPTYSFGIKLPQPVAVQQSVNKDSPAANTYNVGTTIGKATAITIAGRPNPNREVKQGPCPAAYNPVQKNFDKYRATTLTYRWFEPEEPVHPGPADYSITSSNLKSNPSYSCRRRIKATYPDDSARPGSDVPGPGSYNLVKDFVANDQPAFSLRKKLDPVVDREHFPGPSAYGVDKKDKPGAKKAPMFSMAKRLNPLDSRRNNPGPAEYTPKLPTSDRAMWTMTMRPKRKGTFVNPAPNKYTLPEAIAGKNKGVGLKSRASPYVYSGYRTTKLDEPRYAPSLPAIHAN